MNTSTAAIDYNWVSKWRFWLSCAVSIVFLTVGVAFLCLGHVGWRLAGGVSLFLGLAMLIQKKTIVDKSRGLLRVVHRFLGFLPVWQRTLHFDRFDAVVIEKGETYHPSRPLPESEDYDIHYRIGLRRRIGRPYWIRHESVTNGQPCLRGEEVARRLSCDTGLEIVEIDVEQSGCTERRDHAPVSDQGLLTRRR